MTRRCWACERRLSKNSLKSRVGFVFAWHIHKHARTYEQFINDKLGIAHIGQIYFMVGNSMAYYPPYTMKGVNTKSGFKAGMCLNMIEKLIKISSPLGFR